jgi:GTPase SAR1 family protein
LSLAKGKHSSLLCRSFNDEEKSFQTLKPEWLREIEEYASPKVLKVLVGKKTFHVLSWAE